METNKKWSELPIKAQTASYIDHVNEKYYRSYLSDSERFERINNRYHLLIVLIGFLTTILLALKSRLAFLDPHFNLIVDIVTLCLPSISATMLLYVTQKGFKNKEALRENARIACKHLVNKARIDFASCQTDDDYKKVYYWLNDEIRNLQLSQANGHFVSQEGMNKGE